MKPPKKLKLTYYHLPAMLAAFAASATPLFSQTVSWGTTASETGPVIYNAAGTASPGYTWTVGYFNTGFTPTTANATSWFSNYNIVQTSPELTGGGDVFYGVSGEANYSAASPAVNQQIYVFAYNNSGLVGSFGGEALLFTQPGLLFPGSNSVTLDVENGPGTEDDTLNVIWGRVDRLYGATDGIAGSNGIFGNALGDNAFEAQFGGWAIPEPSAAALAMIGGLVALRRRRVG